ncbi:hypothetical protein B0H14DRAFT_2582106 [Mycena olivaceomarginata]|nr:hypothetical protein B0H14DRAFT_2582106 [Mycena olivaceomarginata]
MHAPTNITFELAQNLGADCAVAIGGGSAVGLAKAIALRTVLPQIVIPTSYFGSEASTPWPMPLNLYSTDFNTITNALAEQSIARMPYPVTSEDPHNSEARSDALFGLRIRLGRYENGPASQALPYSRFGKSPNLNPKFSSRFGANSNLLIAFELPKRYQIVCLRVFKFTSEGEKVFFTHSKANECRTEPDELEPEVQVQGNAWTEPKFRIGVRKK